MKASPPVIGVIVALVLAVAFYFLLYKPADEEQAAIQAETLALQDQEVRLRNEIAALQAIERDQVAINAARARLLEYIPEGPSQPSAIRQFQRAADDAGVDIVSVAFAEPAIPDTTTGVAPAETGDPATTLTNIPITMVLNGGYFRIVDFFRRVEVDVQRAVLVQSVAVIEAEPAGFPTLQATWTGHMFAVLPVEDVGTTGGAVPGPTPSPGATPTPTPTPAAGGES